MEKLQENLKELTEDYGISMAKLARETKVPPQTINNWLAGAEPKSITQLKRVADYFEMSINELCFEDINQFQTKKLEKYTDEINAGVFEVVLRRIKR